MLALLHLWEDMHVCVYARGVCGEVYTDVCEGGVEGQRYMFGSGDVIATPTWGKMASEQTECRSRTTQIKLSLEGR